MVKKFGSEATATPRAKASRVAPGPKKSVKPKTVAPKSKKVCKSTTIPGAIVMPQGDRTPAALAKVIESECGSTEASGKEALTAFTSTAPLESAKLTKKPTEASGRKVSTALPGDRLAGIILHPSPM